MDSLLETIDSMRLLQKNYTRDNLYFGYDYKQDLEKTALERERIFRLKNIREETVESDDDTFFDKAPLEDEKPSTEIVQEVTKPKKEKRPKLPAEELGDDLDQEQAEFPEELPANFGMMKFAGART